MSSFCSYNIYYFYYYVVTSNNTNDKLLTYNILLTNINNGLDNTLYIKCNAKRILKLDNHNVTILYNNDDHYLTHDTLYPMLAGTIAVKCKIKKKYYEYIQNKITCTIKNYAKSNDNKDVMFFFDIGYDEILLQELYRPIYNLRFIEGQEKKTFDYAKYIFEEFIFLWIMLYCYNFYKPFRI